MVTKLMKLDSIRDISGTTDGIRTWIVDESIVTMLNLLILITVIM